MACFPFSGEQKQQTQPTAQVHDRGLECCCLDLSSGDCGHVCGHMYLHSPTRLPHSLLMEAVVTTLPSSTLRQDARSLNMAEASHVKIDLHFPSPRPYSLMTSVTSTEAVPTLADAVFAVPRSSWHLVRNGSVDSGGGTV